MADYTLLSQDLVEPNTPTKDERHDHKPNNIRPLHNPDILRKAVYAFLTVMIGINLACMFQTSWTISSVYTGMHGRGEIHTDTRDLPRANIYDGLVA